MRNWSKSLLLGLIGVFVVGEMGFGKDGAELRSTSEAMELRRGALALEWRVPAGADGVKCVVVLASGDGGWSGWEEAVSRRLVRHGCLVVGVDMQKYAATDFDEEILGSDFAKIAGAGVERGGGKDLPVLYVGWSMGAVEVVAAAAYEGRPANLKGILLISAGKRGRFGLRLPDRAGVPPYGAGTFALSDFTAKLVGLRVAQIQGGFDIISSTEWIESLEKTGPMGGGVPSAVQLIRVDGVNHGLNGPDERGFLAIEEGIRWLLENGK